MTAEERQEARFKRFQTMWNNAVKREQSAKGNTPTTGTTPKINDDNTPVK